jgi:hypothetical protein
MTDITARPILTTYWRDKEVVKTTRAKHPDKAVLHCVDHMQLNDYGATTAEVYDTETGEPHATVTHSVVGEVFCYLHREGKEYKA